ncbi:hypothetical protein JKP88DRAFT_299065 [Tribonema minus]|uniref:Uncharacterized protein n=1 Tax=Tribonema minus TaxID=303371 RepID=A0A836CL61_9STRA|nr:hypothetical protein JKP88DRAFT_299065 [Tribonema minus]
MTGGPNIQSGGVPVQSTQSCKTISGAIGSAHALGRGHAGCAWQQRRKALLQLTTPLRANQADDDDEEVEYYEEVDDSDEAGELQESEVLENAQLARLKLGASNFQRLGWFSWWSQTILSTVSAIIILFSNAITERSVRGNALGNGVFLAGLAVASAGASMFWTWTLILKATAWVGRNEKKRSTPTEAQRNIIRALKVGVWINLLGALFALVGAEQIVGTLVAKVLYSGGITQGQVVASSIPATQQFRALDIFIIQANTNTLLSHFVSLAINLLLLARARTLTMIPKRVLRAQ